MKLNWEKWKKYAPSNKLIAYFIIPAISIGMIFLANYFLEKKMEEKEKMIMAEKKEGQKDLDSDNDGLPDWEENLLGTDKNNKDTDGDGLPDGLEYNTDSDPLDPTNKKKLEKEAIEEATKERYNYKLDPTLTATDRVAFEFLEESFGLKKDGMAHNKSAHKDVANRLIQNNKIKVNLQRYKISDLNVNQDILAKDFKAKLLKILQELKDKKLIEETLLLNTYLYNGKQRQYLDLIEENTKIYNEFIQRLLKLKVPKSISQEYLNYLNAFSMVVETNNYYAKIDTDPVLAAQAMGLYKQTDTYFAEKLKELSEKLNQLTQ